MSFVDVATAAREKLVADWVDGVNPRTPIMLQNQSENEQLTPWIRFSFLPGQGDVETIGGAGLNRQTGIVQVSIFIPLNTGTSDALLYMDLLKPIFDRVTLAGAQFSAPSTNIIGTKDKEKWHQSVVSWPWDMFE